METRFKGLSEKASHRRQRLLDSNQLFNFFREADEVEAWIAERESIATSDDYGHDLEHVETLLKKFEDFTRDLVTSGERIANLTEQAQALLDEGNSEGEVRKHFFFEGGGGGERAILSALVVLFLECELLHFNLTTDESASAYRRHDRTVPKVTSHDSSELLLN